MAWPEGPSGDDRTPDRNASGEENLLALSIPDDARELADDVASYRREIRVRQRRERIDRLTLARFWRPYGITGPVVIAALVVICSVSGLLLALLPNARQSQPQASDLGNATAREGLVGGFVPDDSVFVDGQEQSARALRPGVLALVPPHCGCATTIAQLATQATEFNLWIYIVTGTDKDPQLAGLLASKATRRAGVYDPGAKLRLTYSGKTAGVTAIVVRGDGIVSYIKPDANPTTTIRGALTLIDQPAA